MQATSVFRPLPEAFEDLQYKILTRIAPTEPSTMDGSAYRQKSKLQALLGENVFELVQGKTVIDYGCGSGRESVELVRNGAAHVIGLDIQEHILAQAREYAHASGVDDRCLFSTSVSEPVDVIVSLDSFEHFSDPELVLREIWKYLKPGGCLLAAFGPTWYHPLGGHLFSVFPWAHLLFSEKALIRWRGRIRDDGARCFAEVAGGLNQMTIRRFMKIVEGSDFQQKQIKTVAIRRLSAVHNRWTREFTTATVRCILTKAA